MSKSLNVIISILVVIVITLFAYSVMRFSASIDAEKESTPTLEQIQSMVVSADGEPISTFYNSKYDMILDFAPDFKNFTYDFVDRQDIVYERTTEKYGSWNVWKLYLPTGDTIQRTVVVKWEIAPEMQ